MKQIQFDYEVSLDMNLLSEKECDEWGTAILFPKLNDHIGVEYNFCRQRDESEKLGYYDSSAIYKMEWNIMEGYMETYYSNFKDYHIDFNDAEWKTKLKKAMIKAFHEFYQDFS